MSQLLEGIDAGDLLQHMPSNMRTSLETLERAGTDWNAVGNLLVATPTAGVALTGTGQWTADLWEAVKYEFRSFLCTDSERYAELRLEWDDLKQRSPALAVSSLSSLIGATPLAASRSLVAAEGKTRRLRSRSSNSAVCARLRSTATARAGSTSPSSPASGVSRRSALSARNNSRCSARDVNIRYGSWISLVTRSSISTPI